MKPGVHARARRDRSRARARSSWPASPARSCIRDRDFGVRANALARRWPCRRALHAVRDVHRSLPLAARRAPGRQRRAALTAVGVLPRSPARRRHRRRRVRAGASRRDGSKWSGTIPSSSSTERRTSPVRTRSAPRSTRSSRAPRTLGDRRAAREGRRRDARRARRERRRPRRVLPSREPARARPAGSRRRRVRRSGSIRRPRRGGRRRRRRGAARDRRDAGRRPGRRRRLVVRGRCRPRTVLVRLEGAPWAVD